VDKDTGKPLSGEDIAIQEGPGADDLTRWRLSRANRHGERGHNTAASTNSKAPAKQYRSPK
jgi:hypothetical protein